MVSFGIILINVSQYGVDMAGVGEWLERCMIVLFWMDCGLAVCFSIGIYLLMFVSLINSPMNAMLTTLGGQPQLSPSLR